MVTVKDGGGIRCQDEILIPVRRCEKACAHVMTCLAGVLHSGLDTVNQ
jgi:hypothetical protein